MGQGEVSHRVWWLVVILAFAGCATTRVGNPCEYDTECSEGLVCKGAVCGPARSPRDGICVTDRGCEEGLSCMDGVCAEGLADGVACEAACGNVGRLMMGEMQSEGPPPEAGEATGKSGKSLEVLTFEMDCHRECDGQMSLARTRCMVALKTLDDLKICP